MSSNSQQKNQSIEQQIRFYNRKHAGNHARKQVVIENVINPVQERKHTWLPSLIRPLDHSNFNKEKIASMPLFKYTVLNTKK